MLKKEVDSLLRNLSVPRLTDIRTHDSCHMPDNKYAIFHKKDMELQLITQTTQEPKTDLSEIITEGLFLYKRIVFFSETY